MSIFASCNKDNSILTGENCKCWTYTILNSEQIKPIFGICFKYDNTAYEFTDNYNDSTRYINDLVIDADPGGLENIYFDWNISSTTKYLKLGIREFKILEISQDSIIYSSKSGLIFKLEPAAEGFIENWDIQYGDDYSVHNKPMN